MNETVESLYMASLVFSDDKYHCEVLLKAASEIKKLQSLLDLWKLKHRMLEEEIKQLNIRVNKLEIKNKEGKFND